MTHAAQRTASRRKAAGSRRNKKYRFVGTQRSDSNWNPDRYQHWLNSAKPNHAARVLSRNQLDTMFPILRAQVHEH